MRSKLSTQDENTQSRRSKVYVAVSSGGLCCGYAFLDEFALFNAELNGFGSYV